MLVASSSKVSVLVSVRHRVHSSLGSTDRQLMPWERYQREISGQGQESRRLHDMFHFGRRVCRFNVLKVTVLQANLLTDTIMIDH
jgi:hypothetical protein